MPTQKQLEAAWSLLEEMSLAGFLPEEFANQFEAITAASDGN